jgi:ribose transport system substrate-binding protein
MDIHTSFRGDMNVKKARTTMTVASIALATVLLTACGQAGTPSSANGSGGSSNSTAASSHKQFVVGVSMYTLTNPYFAAMKQSFEENATKDGVTVHVSSANGDQATQLAQIESFINQKVNAVVIAPQNSDSIVSAVTQLNNAHIPVFFIDSNANPKLMQQEGATEVEVVQSDNYKGGQAIGQELVAYLGSNPKATVGVVNFPEAQSCRDRDQGFLDVIKQYPGIKVVATQDGKATPTTGLSVGTEMLTGHPDINIVFSDNGPDSQGVLQAIKSENKTGKVFLFGFSSSRPNIQAIQDNSIFKGGAQQVPTDEAKIELGNIVKYLNGGSVPAQVLAPVPGVTKDNAQAAYAKSFG